MEFRTVAEGLGRKPLRSEMSRTERWARSASRDTRNKDVTVTHTRSMTSTQVRAEIEGNNHRTMQVMDEKFEK